jgi:hypothetical protein
VKTIRHCAVGLCYDTDYGYCNNNTYYDAGGVRGSPVVEDNRCFTVIIITIIIISSLHIASQSLNTGLGAMYGPLILHMLTASLHRTFVKISNGYRCSSVDIATRYGLSDSGFEPRWRSRFSPDWPRGSLSVLHSGVRSERGSVHPPHSTATQYFYIHYVPS